MAVWGVHSPFDGLCDNPPPIGRVGRVPVAPGEGQSPGLVTDSLPRQSVGVGGWQRSPIWPGSRQAFREETPVSRGNQTSKECCSL